jgi:hypothetical protein
VAIVEVTSGRPPKLLSTWGNPFLGGHDVKHQLLDIVCRDPQQKLNLVDTPAGAQQAWVSALTGRGAGNRSTNINATSRLTGIPPVFPQYAHTQ